MIRWLVVILMIVGFTGCEKIHERLEEQVERNILTDGQWKITSFQEDSVDLSSSFKDYLFQFKSDSLVEASKNGVVEATGIWKPDLFAQTIEANFINATHPLLLINGTWSIDKGGMSSVEASMIINGKKREMKVSKL